MNDGRASGLEGWVDILEIILMRLGGHEGFAKSSLMTGDSDGFLVCPGLSSG
jgi:hypothetical protein